jgi:hypothetical protein
MSSTCVLSKLLRFRWSATPEEEIVALLTKARRDSRTSLYRGTTHLPYMLVFLCRLLLITNFREACKAVKLAQWASVLWWLHFWQGNCILAYLAPSSPNQGILPSQRQIIQSYYMNNCGDCCLGKFVKRHPFLANFLDEMANIPMLLLVLST